MTKSVANPITRLLKATGYSLAGLRAAYKNEQAFRQEVWLCFILLPLAIYLTDVAVERALLIGVWLLVMITELMNSAVEAVVDRIGDEWHELAGRAKDMASAAVMLTLFLALTVWLLVLL